MCHAACASCSGRDGRGWYTGPPGACSPLGVADGHKCAHSLVQSPHPCTRGIGTVTGSPTAQTSAHHRPGLGAKNGLRKTSQVDQRVLPALEETPQHMSSSHAAPRRIPDLQMGARLDGQTALSP